MSEKGLSPPPTKRTISGWLDMRPVKVIVELEVRPTSATSPMVCGKLEGPTGSPVLKQYSGEVAFSALLEKSPTLHGHSCAQDGACQARRVHKSCTKQDCQICDLVSLYAAVEVCDQAQDAG